MQDELKYLIQYEALVHLYFTLTAFFGKVIKSCRAQMRYRWLILLSELSFNQVMKQYICLIPFRTAVLRL
jgi:hypothetical protein